MIDFPTEYPQDAEELLYGMLIGKVPFDQRSSEQAAWNMAGYGMGQISKEGKSIDWSKPPAGPSYVAACLNPSKKGLPIPWDTLVPAIIQLFLQAFFPTKGMTRASN